MKRYETLILTVPEITKDECSWLEMELSKLISRGKGSLISFDKWGKYRLTFSIRRNNYGVYFLIRFEVEGELYTELLKEMDAFFKVKAFDVVMRTLTTVLDLNKSLEYQKPPSLEDSPSHDVDKFLKENKIDGMLSKPGAEAPKTEAGVKDKPSDNPEKSSSEEKIVKEVKEEAKVEAKTEEVVVEKAVSEKEEAVEEVSTEEKPAVEENKPKKEKEKVEESIEEAEESDAEVKEEAQTEDAKASESEEKEESKEEEDKKE